MYRIMSPVWLLVLILGSLIAYAAYQAPTDVRYPDKDDQLILFRLQARIRLNNQRFLDAQRVMNEADKDNQEADPQYKHAIDVARNKLPKPPDGKVWVGREDAANAFVFTLADAKPAAQVEKKDQP